VVSWLLRFLQPAARIAVKVGYQATRLWISHQQAVEREWARRADIGLREAQRACAEAQARIRAAVPQHAPPSAQAPIRTPATWNRGLPAGVLLILASWGLASGCFVRYVTVDGPWPVLDLIGRPPLPEVPAEFTFREHLLVDYAGRLERQRDAYNREARRHNAAAPAPKGEK
jgi:hypothetical protein